MPEPEIIRHEVFVVDSTTIEEQYGKMTITDKEGKTHTVNKKHEALHSVFADGMAVEVGIASFQNREYIHTARQVKDGIPAPVPIKKVEAPTEQVAKPVSVATPKPTISKDEQIAEMVRVKELGECYRVGMLENLPQQKQDYLDFISGGGGKVLSWQTKWLAILEPLEPEFREKLLQGTKNTIARKLAEVE